MFEKIDRTTVEKSKHSFTRIIHVISWIDPSVAEKTIHETTRKVANGYLLVFSELTE